MIVGIDAGGTNTDGVLLSDSRIVSTCKLPSPPDSVSSIGEVLSSLRGSPAFREGELDRVVIGTTLVLNAAVQDRMDRCGCLLIPGPGLDPRLAMKGELNRAADGYIDHRGRRVEDLVHSQVRDFIEGTEEVGCYAVVGKFSPRNPELEMEAAELMPGAPLSMGHQVGGDLNFPRRAASTVLNAKSLPLLGDFLSELDGAMEEAGVSAPVYLVKSDGAMLSRRAASKLPAATLRSGPAASTLGLMTLTGEERGVAVDIGGTTTDLGMVEGSLPMTEKVSRVNGEEVSFPSVISTDIPLGGDSAVSIQGGKVIIEPRRRGPSAAFGGEWPTLTDALHVTGDFTSGDRGRAEEAIAGLAASIGSDPGEMAREVIDTFGRMVSSHLEEFLSANHLSGEVKLLGGGVLSRFILPSVAEREGMECIIPRHAEVAGAVGCAVSKVAMRTTLHIDTARGYMIANGIRTSVESGREFGEEELRNMAREWAIRTSEEAGMPPGPEEVELLNMRYFNVVQGGRKRGQISDLEAQVRPGVSREVDLSLLRGDAP
ncbi:MAG: hydantoinase/oxoprolinase family protein [Methanomassiliicoccales archaeon]